jgi:very-short-patch-repair endonuclease
MKSGIVFLQKVEDYKVRQARALRRNMTEAERVLWKMLRNRQTANLKFRRQQVAEGFIADFFCEEIKLVIELDGRIHNKKEQAEIDKHRDEDFNARGIRVMRISNTMVLHKIAEVLKKFKEVAGLL